MSIARMQKIGLAAHSGLKEEVLDLLQKNSCLEINENTNPLFNHQKNILENELNEIHFAINLLSPLAKKTSLWETLTSPLPVFSKSRLKEKYQEGQLQKIIRQLKDCEVQLANIKNRAAKLSKDQEALAPWQNLEPLLEDLFNLEKAAFFLGSIKNKDFYNLQKKLATTSLLSELSLVSQTPQKNYILVACHKSQAQVVEMTLNQFSFQRSDLPLAKYTVQQEIQNLSRAIKENQQQEKEIQKEIKKNIVHLPLLKEMCDFIQNEIEMLKAQAHLLDSCYTFYLSGWMLQKKIEGLKVQMEKISPQIFLCEIAAKENEEPPIFLENNAFLRPFQEVTTIYGLPKYNEVDPSAFLALFFISFFGLCLGDAGYGLLTAFIMGVLVTKMPKTAPGRSLFTLLFYGGITTIISGIIQGTYFGLDASGLPSGLSFLKSLRLMDPIKDPIFLLIISIILGVIQILFGLIIKMGIKIREKNYASAFLDSGAWLFFLISILLFILDAANITQSGWGAKLAVCGAIILVLTQGRDQKNIFMRLINGILSLYNSVAYLSDVLSYSRILALGLATAVIGMVVNLLGSMCAQIPYIGYLLMLPILLGGHIFNIIISTLGSFIHSARLQFVEFFSKFLEGGGRAFKPFKRTCKYILIE